MDKKVRLVAFLDWQLRQAFKVCSAHEGKKISNKLEELILAYVKDYYPNIKGDK